MPQAMKVKDLACFVPIRNSSKGKIMLNHVSSLYKSPLWPERFFLRFC